VSTYLRRLLPWALLTLPFCLALPFVVNPDRLELVLSGAVPPLRLAAGFGLIVCASLAMSAALEWGERRNRRKPPRR
jgi:hypothetical protein